MAWKRIGLVSLVPIVLGLFLFGCGQLTLSQNAADGRLRSDNHLPGFPLQTGNTWIYSSTHYMDDGCSPEGITARFLITETVVDTQTSPVFAAQVTRETRLVSASAGWTRSEPDGLEIYWYVISGTHVYKQQDPLDLDIGKAGRLEYIFPLESGRRWYPNYDKRQRFANFELDSELRRVSGPVAADVPAGAFDGCFFVTEVTGGYTTNTRFCPGIGVVESKGGHTGRVFGHTDVLIEYSVGAR